MNPVESKKIELLLHKKLNQRNTVYYTNRGALMHGYYTNMSTLNTRFNLYKKSVFKIRKNRFTEQDLHRTLHQHFLIY